MVAVIITQISVGLERKSSTEGTHKDMHCLYPIRRKLTDAYNICFTCDDSTQPRISSSINSHRDSGTVVGKETVSEGLFVLHHNDMTSMIPQLGNGSSPNFPYKLGQAFNATTVANSPMFWHQKLGKISPDRPY